MKCVFYYSGSSENTIWAQSVVINSEVKHDSLIFFPFLQLFFIFLFVAQVERVWLHEAPSRPPSFAATLPPFPSAPTDTTLVSHIINSFPSSYTFHLTPQFKPFLIEVSFLFLFAGCSLP